MESRRESPKKHYPSINAHTVSHKLDLQKDEETNSTQSQPNKVQNNHGMRRRSQQGKEKTESSKEKTEIKEIDKFNDDSNL